MYVCPQFYIYTQPYIIWRLNFQTDAAELYVTSTHTKIIHLAAITNTYILVYVCKKKLIKKKKNEEMKT